MAQTVSLEVSGVAAWWRRVERGIGASAAALGVFILVSAGTARLVEWRADCRASEVARARRASLVELVTRTAARVGLDGDLALAVARAESNFDPGARSSRGAVGIMQVMPATGHEVAQMLKMRHWDLWDPADNALLGTTYLRLLLRRYDGNRELALAAYHAGPARVDGWIEMGQGLPGELVLETFAFPVTRAYVARVLGDA